MVTILDEEKKMARKKKNVCVYLVLAYHLSWTQKKKRSVSIFFFFRVLYACWNSFHVSYLPSGPAAVQLGAHEASRAAGGIFEYSCIVPLEVKQASHKSSPTKNEKSRKYVAEALVVHTYVGSVIAQRNGIALYYCCLRTWHSSIAACIVALRPHNLYL